ncbi:MAG: type-F conjugative transfer system mating-pair stabilization protein TraN, partial [Burkholderiales bacterium]
MRKLITYLTLLCFVITQTNAVAGPHEEGLAAGAAANPVIRDNVTAPSASSAVPNYTNTPAETAYYGQSLTSQANARLTSCATAPDDPVCQAQRGAFTSANTPRPAVSPYDPAVVGAREIARNPSAVLGSLSSFYSGCVTTDATAPSGSTSKLCNRYVGVGNYSSRRDLTVEVNLVPSCPDGEWFVQGTAWRNALDHMHADAQCRIRADGKQRFRFYAAGAVGACIDWQALDLPIALTTEASFVTDLSPHWQGSCWSGFKVVLMPGSGCVDGDCNYNFRFGTPLYACAAGSVRGDELISVSGDEYTVLGAADQCFTVAPPDAIEVTCPSGTQRFTDYNGTHCASPSGPATLIGASGWGIPLAFAQPTMNHTETDVWDDKRAVLADGGRCVATTADRCIEGPSTKVISGRPVTRACWAYEQSLACASGASLNECAPLAAAGCTPSGSVCKQMNPATGVCEVFQDTYSCPTPAETTTTASNCPSNVFCLGSSCFNTNYTNDTDFARSMSMMEAAREAGVYIDPDSLQVFKGEANSCRDRLLKNCCYTDSAGAGMTNQSVLGVGSRLVYDVLMNSENRQFIYQGINALLTGAGFSGSFTTYGVTFAVNGDAVPAGSVTLAATDSLVIAFDPWSLVIAIVIYVVMSMMSCNENEGKLAMKEGAGLCHSIGTYCSSCIRVLGSCVACIEHTTGKCCFNSSLSRIVNEQGRGQIGKGWGGAESPDCSGFTIAQLQSLDFAAMDLTEFYASIVPTLPNLNTISTNNAARISN